MKTPNDLVYDETDRFTPELRRQIRLLLVEAYMYG